MFLILQQKLYDACKEIYKVKVNVISESAFTAQGHGVHTAFTETIDALREYTDWDVAANDGKPADVVHIHTTGPYSLSKLLWSRGVKVVSAHVTPDSFVGSVVGAKYWYGLAKLYLRWFYNQADGVLAVSGEVHDELLRMGVRKPIFLVPNTIRTQTFESSPEKRKAARTKLGIPEAAFVVVGNGQVQPRKRIDSFLSAAESVPNATFVWVGGIPFKKLAAESVAMTKIMENPPANVQFPGLMKREDVVAYYQAADIFFLPSAQETFGIVIVEAAAAGLPVLLRDLDQYRDTFGSGYETGTDETFGPIIEHFRTDRKYYDKWSDAARSIAERYGAQNGAVTLMKVYLQLLGSQVAQQKTEA